jgi:DNA-binding CsgD family transcriptional regulator
MKSFTQWLRKYLRSATYLLATFPIACLLFAFVTLGIASGVIFPVAAVIFLVVMSSMERVAAFEVRRTNRLMKTDFDIPQPWLVAPLASWDGIKERVTSLRGWMTMLYVPIVFGWSIFSVVLIVLGLSGVVLTLISLGLVALSNFDRSFQVVDGGDKFAGTIHYSSGSGHVQLIFGDAVDTGSIGWNFGSYWGLAIGVACIAWALIAIPGNARGITHLVQGLLTGTFETPIREAIDTVVAKFQSVSKKQVAGEVDNSGTRPTNAKRQALDDLTDREQEILGLVAQGLSNSAISKALFITEGSVEKHVSNIMLKLGLPVTSDSHRRVLATLAYLEQSKDS